MAKPAGKKAPKQPMPKGEGYPGMKPAGPPKATAPSKGLGGKRGASGSKAAAKKRLAAGTVEF